MTKRKKKIKIIVRFNLRSFGVNVQRGINMNHLSLRYFARNKVEQKSKMNN